MTTEELIIKKNNPRLEKKEAKLRISDEVRRKLIDRRRAQNKANPKSIDEIETTVWQYIEESCRDKNIGFRFSTTEKKEILDMIEHVMFGFGILEPLIHDKEITEIMVNSKDNIFVERNGQLMQALDKNNNPLAFESEQELMRIIERIVMPINRKVDESSPIADARLPNGFRVNIVLKPLSLGGNIITIRKFPENPYTMQDLVKMGMHSEEMDQFLRKLVKARYNIVISGGTGSGKTTFLNALSNYIPYDSRIVTIEDSAELKISNIKNLVRLETRTANIEGKGEVNMRELVRAALRMRPDRIIVGEVRGGEALDMLQAMNTGHDGSLSTGHANSAEDMLARLETMVLMADVELPLAAVRRQIASSVDIIVHLAKFADGKRRVAEVVEITPQQDGGYCINPLYHFDGEAFEAVRTCNKMINCVKFQLNLEKEQERKLK